VFAGLGGAVRGEVVVCFLNVSLGGCGCGCGNGTTTSHSRFS